MAAGGIGELTNMLRAVTRIEETDGLARSVTEELLRLIPGVSASYNEVDLATGRAFARIVPEPRPDWWARYQPVFEAHMGENPLLQRLQRDGRLDASTWCEVDPDLRFRSTELFRSFYQPLGIEEQLVSGFTDVDGTLIGVAVNRATRHFTDRERQLLDGSREIAAVARRLVALDTERRALRATLADDGWQVISVGADGRAIDASVGELDAGDDLGRVVAEAIEEHVPRHSVDHEQPEVVRLADAERGRRTVLVAGALPPHLVLVQRSVAPQRGRIEALGLTARQCDVAERLATGADNGQIAADLGIAPGTVKKHLESVYAALGVRTRAAAVAALIAVGSTAG